MANVFTVKQIEAEILGELYTMLEDKIKYSGKHYEVIGTTDVQDTDWRTGELLWEDEEMTVPKFKREWGYVDIPDEAISEYDRTKVEVCKDLMAKLEKLV